MERKMFYGAPPLIFQRAKQLRNQLTSAERALWDILKNNLPGYKFRRQHPVGNFIADFYCYKLKLIIEADGSIHNNDDVKAWDEERQKMLEDEGITVIRFTNDEVMKDEKGIVREIERVIALQLVTSSPANPSPAPPRPAPPNPLKGEF